MTRTVSLSCVALLALLAGHARGEVSLPEAAPAQAGATELVGELIGDRIARYFASQQARENALPSYALEKENGPGKALNNSVSLQPVFSMVDGKHSAVVKISAGTSLYGTGEVAGPLLRNGRSVVAWNTDAYGYQDEAESLYKSHPWVLAVRPDGTAFGVLADTTYRCTIDTAARASDEIRFTADGPAFPVIIIERATPLEVVQAVTKLTGLPPLPALWTLGYHQCRYSYFPEARVREIAKNFRDRDIPADVIWYDIDYYESFRCFTFDPVHFPDPKKLNADLLADGFHNVWMINPGIKSREEPSPNEPPAEVRAKEPVEIRRARETQRDVFRAIRDSGKAQDVYVKRADNSVYEGEVWPGWCFFPDYTQPRVREWWAPNYGPFMAHGITGVWNDMNEPAIFNVKSKTMPEDNIHLGDPTLLTPMGSPQGEAKAKGDHARYHNVYGMMMVKGSREGIQAANPDKRPFVLSRATFMGGQRYHAGWSGDNTANWYHIEASVPMTLNVALSGLSFYGPDIGGFAGNGDAQMFERWIGFGALLPFCRGHTGTGNIDKEPWAFGAEVEETSRLAIQRRYRLMPYIYTLFKDASVNGTPVLQPLFFTDAKNPALRSEDDGFLLGGDLLVVPQLVPDRSRVAVMPSGNWRELAWDATNASPKNTTKGLDSQNEDLPRLYVRPGAIIPTGPVMEFTSEKPLDPITLIISLDANGKARGELYEDAGDGYAYRNAQEFRKTTYIAERKGDSVRVTIEKTEGALKRPQRNIVVRLLTDTGDLMTTGQDGDVLTLSLK
ncbi:MAG: TIM-barrel domain-containing protein [Phycisphaerales bacterium]